jgi:hypothetical protein
MFGYVKVFGERNTGTNYVHKLVARNTKNTILLKHGANDVIEEQVASFSECQRPFVRELLIDNLRIEEFDQNFGWKHAFITPEKLKLSPLFNDCFFIFISRNPFRFLFSLYNNPYNVYLKNWNNVGEFLRSRWFLTHRDNLGLPYVSNPVLLWNIKTKSYLETSKALENAVFFKYEAVVSDYSAFLYSLDPYLLLKAPRKNIDKSTKGDDLTFSDYAREAANMSPCKYFCREDIEFILSQLDEDLCDKLDYFPN